MGPPLQDFLCAFEPSDWVFPVAHSANCCAPSTSKWTLSLAQVPKSLVGRLTSILPSLDVKTARSWRGIVASTHLAREGRMAVTIGRRELLVALGGAAAAWPLAARGQQPAVPVLGSDLIGRQPTVIVAAGGDNSARAAIAATTKIPIVFVAGSDPSKSGLVRSLNKPGGNATGVSIFSTEVVGKQLDLPHELMPEATVIGMFVNPNNPNADTQIRGAQEAALARGVGLDVVNVGDDRDLDPAFARLLERRIGAVVVGADPIFLPSAINSLGSQPAMDCR